MKYGNRVFAAVYLLGWIVWATSIIGEPTSGKTITWFSAWSFVLVLAGAMWLGWQARSEVERANDEVQRRLSASRCNAGLCPAQPEQEECLD